MFVEPEIANRDSGACFRNNMGLYETLMRRRLLSGWEASGSGPGEVNLGRVQKLRSSEKSSFASVTTPSSLTNVLASGHSNSDQSINHIASDCQQLDVQPSPSASQPRPSAKRTTTTQASSKSVNAIKQRRDQLVKKAKEMRRQMVGEIGKSKVELWEMTMEQGVLTQLSKDDTLL
jgi:hypothetical protein